MIPLACFGAMCVCGLSSFVEPSPTVSRLWVLAGCVFFWAGVVAVFA